MPEIHSPDLSLSSLLDVNQATSEIISFFTMNSDSMPMVIDHKRIIRYCNPRLREILGYGWQADLINGETLIDVLVPEDFREQHAQLIEDWFRDPVVLQMHARGPIPVMTAGGRMLSALIKLVPYEPREKSMRPIFDTPIFYPLGVAFITLLPESWKRNEPTVSRPAAAPARGDARQAGDGPAYRGETGEGFGPVPRGSAPDPDGDPGTDRGYRRAERQDLDLETAEWITAAISGIREHARRINRS